VNYGFFLRRHNEGHAPASPKKDPLSKIFLGLSAGSARGVSALSPTLQTLARYSNINFEFLTTRLIHYFLLFQNDSSNSAPSLNDVDVVKLQECKEEFDNTPRETKFAFRSTDLCSWAASSPCTGGENTNRDPTPIQHWALVVHFPRGEKTYLFEAGKDENGLLQAVRAEIPFKDFQVFEKATYFGTIETCPCELLEKAKQVSTTKRFPFYNILNNNCQTWLEDFLLLISPDLLNLLHGKEPGTAM
jgi:hypothetical protein